MNEIEQYYNKFNEDKRLLSRHGRVEFYVTYTYIQRHLSAVLDERKCAKSDIKIMDIGAGTGAYCIPLADEGYTVSAVEMVKHNLGILKKKTTLVDARQGNACNMKKYADDTFDVTLLFGPMYHLF